MGTSPLRSRSTRCSAGYRCVRFPVVATRRLGISSGMGTWSACSATSEPSGGPFPVRFSRRLTFAPGSHPWRERGPPSRFPILPRLVTPENHSTVALVLLAGVVREAARGVPDPELTRRGRVLLRFVIVRASERETRLETRPRAVGYADGPSHARFIWPAFGPRNAIVVRVKPDRKARAWGPTLRNPRDSAALRTAS